MLMNKVKNFKHSVSHIHIQNRVTSFIRLTLLIAIGWGLYDRRYVLAILSFAIFFLTYLPSLIERKYRIELPDELELLTILFIYASLFLGELHGYYTRFWWWDVVLHISSGFALGFTGFLILYILYYKNKIAANPFLISLFSFCFALAIGALWEIFEFFIDSNFGFNMQKSGLRDTMWDLIVDSGGAFFFSFIGYFYLKGKKTPIVSRIINNFVRNNRELFG